MTDYDRRPMRRPMRRPFPLWVRVTVALGLIVALVGGAVSGWSVLTGGAGAGVAGSTPCTPDDERRASVLLGSGLLESLPQDSRGTGGWSRCARGEVTIARSFRAPVAVGGLVTRLQDAPILAGWQLEGFDESVSGRREVETAAGLACLSHGLDDGTRAYALVFVDRAREDTTDFTVYLGSAPNDVRWCDANSGAAA